MGFSSKTPSLLKYISRQIGGIGLLNLQNECTIQRVKMLIGLCRSTLSTGYFLELIMMKRQFLIGSKKSFFLYGDGERYWIPCWFEYDIQHLKDHNITITWNMEWAWLKREND